MSVQGKRALLGQASSAIGKCTALLGQDETNLILKLIDDAFVRVSEECDSGGFEFDT